MDDRITSGQLKRLQVLYSQLARRTFDGGNGGRDARLQWASRLLNRSISSFSEITQNEARHLIDTTQAQLGVKAPSHKRPRMDREMARRAGTEGRKGLATPSATLAGPAELARIQYALDLLGWSQAQLEGWLRSSRSPLSAKADPKIRTLGEANRVWWALKRMAQGHGVWKDPATYARPA